jgi:hypothetical protein
MPDDNIKRPRAAATAGGMAPKEIASMQFDRSERRARPSRPEAGVR